MSKDTYSVTKVEMKIADEAAADVQRQYPKVDYLTSTVYNAVLRAIEKYAKGKLK